METAINFIDKKNRKHKEELQKRELISMKDIGREGEWGFFREAWVFMPSSNLPKHKVFVIERLKKIKAPKKSSYQGPKNLGEIEYRIGYYIVGRIGKMKGRWTWGQYCPIIPGKDLKKLLRLATEKKVLL